MQTFRSEPAADVETKAPPTQARPYTQNNETTEQQVTRRSSMGGASSETTQGAIQSEIRQKQKKLATL